MAYGTPGSEPVQATPMEQLIIWVREDIMGEFQAINQYQAHIDNTDNEEVKALLQHIRDDEKEHVAELTHLLARIDAIQQEKFATDHTTAPEARVVPAAEANTEAKPASSVGSLFGHK